MKKQSIAISSVFKSVAVVALIAAFALLSLPMRLIFGSRAASAETEPQTKASAPVEAPEDTESLSFDLTVNYYRPDGKYNGWSMWVWLIGKEGVDYKFDAATVDIAGSKWATLKQTITVPNPPEAGNVVGFLVKSASWAKDPDVDRFIGIDKIVGNKVSIYLISGSEDVYYSEQEVTEGMQEAKKPKITNAYFVDFNTVRVTTGKEITAKSYFKVYDSTNNVVGSLDCSTASDVVGKKSVGVSITESIDFGKSYRVVDEPTGEVDVDANFSKHSVDLSRLFSTDEFGTLYNYSGNLGADYTPERTVFTVWSPYASAMTLNIYDAGEGGTATTYDMKKGANGTWTETVNADLNRKYYTYTVKGGAVDSEIVDPYARSGGKNGKRGMILDLASTNPVGWETQKMPELKGNTHAVIWEAHVRDVTIHESSGVSEANRGKFLGLTETGTKNKSGKSTALDYIKELGVTEIHFQPIFDFATVDENFTKATYNKAGQFNWGYDPLNYNMPEGSYSSNPSDGFTRVNELKQMIMALHNAGIQVIMDVVYNHVSSADSSNFEKLMPGYFFRKTATGALSNGSGCGNETASERYMFRRFMIDSVKYWMTEYKLDGFRFDLMGLHDVETMNKLYNELAAINPDVLIYGEGWTAASTPLAPTQQCVLANAKKTPNIAYFDDVIRDGLRGSNFDKQGKGFVQGVNSSEKSVYVGVYGATNNFAANPTQNINYVDAHDDSTLWDRLNASVNYSKSTLKAMNRLAATSVYTSQGIAFMLAGEEMLRSKPTTKKNSYDNRPNPYKTNPDYYFSDNSYKSPDSVNAINWDLLDENADMVEYYKALIGIKKAWPQFQLSTKDQVDKCVTVKDNQLDDGVISYVVKDPNSNEYAVVILNNSDKSAKVSVPKGEYDVYINGSKASATDKLSTFKGDKFTVGARAAVVMKGELEASAVSDWEYSAQLLEDEEDNLGLALGLGIGIPAAVLIAGGVVFGVMYGKKKKSKSNGKDDKDEDKAGDEPKDAQSDDEPQVTQETENDGGDAPSAE
ncbi:MAG: type I pullulanase [Clostridiales bacterium]|nr:type I pullulanase [Clostridiales bacterium]